MRTRANAANLIGQQRQESYQSQTEDPIASVSSPLPSMLRRLDSSRIILPVLAGLALLAALVPWIIAPAVLALVGVCLLRYHTRTRTESPRGLHTSAIPNRAVEDELAERRLIIHEVFEAQREAVRDLHRSGSISDAVLRRMERELDGEALLTMVERAGR
jgi:hypothetical protein